MPERPSNFPQPENDKPPQKQEKATLENKSLEEVSWTEWKDIIKVKPQDTPYALRAAKRLGVPENEIKQFAQEEFQKHISGKWYGLAYQIMKAAGLGTEEERHAMGERVYRELLEGNHTMGAVHVAKELWGENSPQHVSAPELQKKEDEAFLKEQKKAEPLIRLARNASFDDFFDVWHEMAAEEGQGIDIEADMNIVFGEQLTKEVMDFLNGQNDSLKNRKVLDFFTEHGFSEDQLGEVIGIKFRKSRSKKK